MTLLRKISLSGKYGKGLYSISLIVTLSAAVSAFFAPSTIPACILLKLLSIPVILYLLISLRRDNTLYFWLNQGISKREYYAIPVIVEFLIFVVLLTVCGVLGNVIG